MSILNDHVYSHSGSVGTEGARVSFLLNMSVRGGPVLSFNAVAKESGNLGNCIFPMCSLLVLSAQLVRSALNSCINACVKGLKRLFWFAFAAMSLLVNRDFRRVLFCEFQTWSAANLDRLPLEVTTGVSGGPDPQPWPSECRVFARSKRFVARPVVPHFAFQAR